MMTHEECVKTMTERLYLALNPSFLEITDDSMHHMGHAGSRNGAGHYTVEIASETLAGKTKVQQHRMVYQALGDLMQEAIHALVIKIK